MPFELQGSRLYHLAIPLSKSHVQKCIESRLIIKFIFYCCIGNATYPCHSPPSSSRHSRSGPLPVCGSWGRTRGREFLQDHRKVSCRHASTCVSHNTVQANFESHRKLNRHAATTVFSPSESFDFEYQQIASPDLMI